LVFLQLLLRYLYQYRIINNEYNHLLLFCTKCIELTLTLSIEIYYGKIGKPKTCFHRNIAPYQSFSVNAHLLANIILTNGNLFRGELMNFFPFFQFRLITFDNSRNNNLSRETETIKQLRGMYGNSVICNNMVTQ